MIGDGWHCSDLITKSGVTDATILKVQNTALAYFTKWHAAWHASVGKGKRALDELVQRMDAVIRANGMPVEERDDLEAVTIPSSVIDASPHQCPPVSLVRQLVQLLGVWGLNTPSITDLLAPQL